TRPSRNAVVVAIIVALATLGAARAIYGFKAAKALTVRFNTSFSHPMLLAGQQQTAFIKVDLAGFEIERGSDRTPVNIAFVLDKSGSMSGQKMEQAIEATIMAIDHLGDGDVVSVVVYDNHARVLMPATEVGDKEAIRHRIRSLVAGGGTALYAGVLQGADQLKEFLDPKRVNRVILLSDGQANQGPSSPSQLGDLGAKLIRDGISVTTIGLGLGYNEDLMTQLALRSDGNHNFVENVDALASVFSQEFGDVLSVVAQNVKVTIECEEGIRPVRVLGREAEINGQTVTVNLNQLYSEQEKYVLLEVETEPSESQDEVEIAQVSMSYANMLTHDQNEVSAKVSARVTASEDVVRENVDKKSMVAAVQQQGILNEEKAIELRDQGRRSEAEEVLRQNAAFYEVSAELYGDDGLSEGAERSRSAIVNLEDDRWNQQRKSMRSDHYKGKVQQSN
ncbi:MAG: VWA domain-containing protein, partial [Rhodothermales bacterium]|nr:VWA domain-containing protein [Rhodothermales bacterium]